MSSGISTVKFVLPTLPEFGISEPGQLQPEMALLAPGLPGGWRMGVIS